MLNSSSIVRARAARCVEQQQLANLCAPTGARVALCENLRVGVLLMKTCARCVLVLNSSSMQTLSQWLSDSSRSCAPLTDTLARQHARDQVLFVTFTNFEQVLFAVNWARQLKVVGLRGLVGTPVELPPAHMHTIRAAGSSFFCANSELIRRNPQAGRWAEVAPLLRFGLHVIISDSDVSWLRNPTVYFHEVRRKHPAVDFLLCTDRAYNGYNGAQLLAAPHQYIRANTDTFQRGADVC